MNCCSANCLRSNGIYLDVIAGPRYSLWEAEKGHQIAWTGPKVAGHHLVAKKNTRWTSTAARGWSSKWSPLSRDRKSVEGPRAPRNFTPPKLVLSCAKLRIVNHQLILTDDNL